MSAIEVLLSGFASFFSIWQVCMLQISPFFIVYLIGLFATSQTITPRPGGLPGWTLLPALAYVIGFGIFFAMLCASGLYIGRYLNYHITALRFGTGIFFLIIAAWFLFADRLSWLHNRLGSWLATGMTLGVGIAMALIYSPCITPTLSKILGVAVHPETAVEGAILAWYYGFGLSLSFGLVGSVLVLALQKTASWPTRAARIKEGCAAVFLILAGMNVTDVMVYYKAFFLGLLVR